MFFMYVVFVRGGAVRKSLVSVKKICLQFWGRKGCANFMGAWKNCVLSAGKNLHAHKIPRFRGDIFLVFGEGASILFYGREDFSDLHRTCSNGRDLHPGNCIRVSPKMTVQ